MKRSSLNDADVEDEEPRSATAKHMKTEKGKKPKKVTDTRSQRKERMRKYVQASFKPGERFGKRAWEVTRLIDNGGFGVVYEAWNHEKCVMAALKAEPTTTTGESQLKQEILVLKSVNPTGKTEHFPQIFFATKHHNYAYIIMSLLGDNLRNLRACEVKNSEGLKRPPEMIRNSDHYLMSVGSWTRVGMQLLYAIKTLHDCGFVHRDIKPANFVIGKGQDMTTLFMLDFGLSRAYAFKIRGKWVPRLARFKANFRGTARYCSPNMHDKMEQGRRDDIWSFFYILIEAHCGLPWQFETDRKELERVKCTMSDEELGKNMPKSLQPCIRSLRHLDIYSRPDYTGIFEALDKIMKMWSTEYNHRYDWEKYNDDYKRPEWFVSRQYHGWSHNPLAHFNSIVVPSLNPADAHKAHESTDKTDTKKSNVEKKVMIPTAVTPLGNRKSITPPPDPRTEESKTDAETKTELTRETEGSPKRKKGSKSRTQKSRTVDGRSTEEGKNTIDVDMSQEQVDTPRSISSKSRTRDVPTFTDLSSRKSGRESRKSTTEKKKR